MSLKEDKRLRLLGMVQSLLHAPRANRKDLERFIGLAMWACILFPVMRCVLHTFYHDLYSPAVTNYGMDPAAWPTIWMLPCISLRSLPIRPSLSVRLTERRLWLRLSNSASSRRKLSTPSLRALAVAEHWLRFAYPQRCVRSTMQLPFEARADASARGSTAIIGGYVCHPCLGQLWFSEVFSLQDFQDLGVSVSSDMASESHAMKPSLRAG